MLSATVFMEGDTPNIMVVYSLLTFVKSVRIVLEVVGRQQTPDSCHFDIHLYYTYEAWKDVWGIVPLFSTFNLQ